MRNAKKASVLAVIVFALGAIGTANASAAQFTYPAEPGLLAGHALETQKLKLNGGTIECKKADMSGVLVSLPPSTEQEMTVTYTECNAFGFPVHISGENHLLFTANGKLHTENVIAFTVTSGLFGECTINVGKQEVGSVTYSGSLIVTPSPITSISYISTGGICGSSGTNGEYSGATAIERVGGGLFTWDA